MLRIVFLLLVLANAGYYLWSHGHLASAGLAPAVQAEPQRLEQQVQPDALRILTPSGAEQDKPVAQSELVTAPAVVEPAAKAEPEATAPAPAEQPNPAPAVDAAPAAPTPTPAPATPAPVVAAAPKEPENCFQASGIEERQAEAIRRALGALPRSQWEMVANHQAGRWMVYMGKFPDAEFQERKRVELKLLNIDFDRAGGNLEPGLSLGRFSSEEAATRQLGIFARQGVRTARVVQERPEVTTYALRLPKATASFKTEVVSLAGKNLEPKALRACVK